MWTNNLSCILPVLIVGMVSMLVLSEGATSSLALGSRRSHEDAADGGQFKLVHWSHPDSPYFIPGLGFAEKFNLAVQRSRERVDVLSRRMQERSAATVAPAPAPESSEFVYPLTYNPNARHAGEYTMEISIGTPPQTFSGIADTYSDLVWVQCSGCAQCQPQLDKLYALTNSSTYKHMSCSDPLCLPTNICADNSCEYEYTDKYFGGINIGNMSYETITLSTTAGKITTAEHFAFGCGFNISFPLGHLFKADGVVGLGQGSLSFASQLGSLFGHKFSYCIVSVLDSNTMASRLLFGGTAVPSQWYTPMVPNPIGSESFYYIGLKGIKVNGVAVNIPSGTFDIHPNGTGGVIPDLGSTVSYLTSAGYSPLLLALKPLINYTVIPSSVLGLDLCYDVSNVSSPAFPVVTMVFEGFDLDLPQDNTFVGGCLAIGDSGTDETIFGTYQQQNFEVLYDREAKVFGFAKVHCDTL